MSAVICGSFAFDTIMVFQDHFKNHILPDRVHALSVAFLVPELRREFGGCAGNIAYNLTMLGGDALPMGTVGKDFAPYAQWMDDKGISRRHVTTIDTEFTAQAFIINRLCGVCYPLWKPSPERDTNDLVATAVATPTKSSIADPYSRIANQLVARKRVDLRQASRVTIERDSGLEIRVSTPDGQTWMPRPVNMSLIGILVEFAEDKVPNLPTGTRAEVEIRLQASAGEGVGHVSFGDLQGLLPRSRGERLIGLHNPECSAVSVSREVLEQTPEESFRLLLVPHQVPSPTEKQHRLEKEGPSLAGDGEVLYRAGVILHSHPGAAPSQTDLER